MEDFYLKTDFLYQKTKTNYFVSAYKLILAKIAWEKDTRKIELLAFLKIVI